VGRSSYPERTARQTHSRNGSTDFRVSPTAAVVAIGITIAADEIESVADLVRWFTTRYPTARERLAYARRAYARWARRGAA